MPLPLLTPAALPRSRHRRGARAEHLVVFGGGAAAVEARHPPPLLPTTDVAAAVFEGSVQRTDRLTAAEAGHLGPAGEGHRLMQAVDVIGAAVACAPTPHTRIMRITEGFRAR